MNYIKKFNENINNLNVSDLIEMCESGQVKLVGFDLNQFKSYIENPNLELKPNNYGICYIGFDCILVFSDENLPIAVITEYELSNPFVFGDVVVCPGHDSITCFNKKSGEYSINYIR